MSASPAPPHTDAVARHASADDARARVPLDWRALFESLDDGFCIVDIERDAAGRPVDYRILDANESFSRHTGLVDPIGRNARDLIPGLEQHWVDLYGGVALSGEPVRRELGSAALGRWFEVHAFPVAASGCEPGALPLVAILFRDVTPRRAAELALLESERRFREVADQAPVMMWMTEADGRCIFLNRPWYRYTGQSEDEALRGDGFGWLEAVHPDDREAAAVAFRDATETASAFRLDYRLRHRPAHGEATYRWCIDAAAPRLTTDGRFVGFVGSVVDVHEQRVAEDRVRAALEAERARLEQLFRRSPSFAVVYRGPEHRYEFVNDAYYQLIGHRDVLGRPIDEVVPEAREQGFTALLDRVYTTGEPITFRETPVMLERTRGAPRELRYVDMVFQALTDVEGRNTGVLAHGVDISEHVLTRREVERLLAVATAERERAEEANRIKGEFLATMSHELRTPLNAIGGHVQLLALGVHGPLAPAQHSALERVDRAQRHLLGLINDLLNYTRLDAGKVEYAMEAVDVCAVVDDVLPLIEPQLVARGLRLELPRRRRPLLAWADRDKLGQVLVNLLANAVKFTPPPAEGRPGVVRIELSARGAAPGAVRIRVRDTGIGIPRTKLQVIFDPFVQLNAGYTTTTPGTGLGLAISRDLVRGMGGELRVQSVEGEGSCFTIALRRCTADEGEAADGAPPVAERRAAGERRVQRDRRRGSERRRGRGGRASG